MSAGRWLAVAVTALGVLAAAPAPASAGCSVSGRLPVTDPLGVKLLGHITVPRSGEIPEGGYLAVRTVDDSGARHVFQYGCRAGRLIYVQRLIAPPNPAEMAIWDGGRFGAAGAAPGAPGGGGSTGPAANIPPPAAAPAPTLIAQVGRAGQLTMPCSGPQGRRDVLFELKHLQRAVKVHTYEKKTVATIAYRRITELAPRSKAPKIVVTGGGARSQKRRHRPLFELLYQEVCGAAPPAKASWLGEIRRAVADHARRIRSERCEADPGFPGCTKFSPGSRTDNPGGVRN